MSRRYLRVVNYGRFQHYKDRRPPWIKLYAELLEDYEFGCLHDASKLHLVLIWLLASRHDNRVPYDPQWIAARIQAKDPVDLETLVREGWLEVVQDASTVLAEPEQPATPETEEEKETENRERDRTDAAAALPPSPPARAPEGPREAAAAGIGSEAWLRTEMRGDLDRWLTTAELGGTRAKSVQALGDALIQGDDYTAWQDTTGSQVPWEERPRLFRLALQHHDAHPTVPLRSALRYVIAQQTDPIPLPKAGERQTLNGKGGSRPPEEDPEKRKREKAKAEREAFLQARPELAEKLRADALALATEKRFEGTERAIFAQGCVNRWADEVMKREGVA